VGILPRSQAILGCWGGLVRRSKWYFAGTVALVAGTKNVLAGAAALSLVTKSVSSGTKSKSAGAKCVSVGSESQPSGTECHSHGLVWLFAGAGSVFVTPDNHFAPESGRFQRGISRQIRVVLKNDFGLENREPLTRPLATLPMKRRSNHGSGVHGANAVRRMLSPSDGVRVHSEIISEKWTNFPVLALECSFRRFFPRAG
jgi:hypothetical protein